MVWIIKTLYYPEKISCTGAVIILGNFDGVHLAHEAVIKKGISYAKEKELTSIILMFENHTKNAKVIMNNEEKLAIFKQMGVECVYIRKFTHDFMKQSPEEFVLMLKDTMSMKAVCTGFDYRCGHKAQGDIKTLEELGKKYGFDVIITDAVSKEGHIISSTYIRKLIADGDVGKAKEFMGRSYSLCGKVEKGCQNGIKLGFPTANVQLDKSLQLPKSGVYAGFSEVEGKVYKSVINVGNNPTFDARKITVESHILDFESDIYEKEIKIFFEKRIRSDIKFRSTEELKEQIKKDIIEAKKLLERSI